MATRERTSGVRFVTTRAFRDCFRREAFGEGGGVAPIAHIRETLAEILGLCRHAPAEAAAMEDDVPPYLAALGDRWGSLWASPG